MKGGRKGKKGRRKGRRGGEEGGEEGRRKERRGEGERGKVANLASKVIMQPLNGSEQ